VDNKGFEKMHRLMTKGAKQWEIKDRTSLSFTLTEKPGVLNQALSILTKNKVNMTSI